MKFLKIVLVAASMIGPSLWAAPKIASPAPDFTLKGQDGKDYKLSDFKGQYVVLEWWNQDCPFVKKHYESGAMQELQRSVTAKGKSTAWFSIISSKKGKGGYLEPVEAQKAMDANKAAPTAILLDTDSKVGLLYEAKTTPHMFIIDPKGNLIYKGAIDDKASSDKADLKDAKNYVRLALDNAMAGKVVDPNTTKPYGCSVKY